MAGGADTEPTTGRLRQLLLLLVLAGAGGLLTELLLLEHYEDAWQWAPLVLLSAATVMCVVLLLRASAGAVRVFRVVMALCVIAGALGLWLHLQGNLEWEREQGEGLTGLAFYWEVLRGATPTLAPGALAQLGLLGLLWSWGHPAASRPNAFRTTEGNLPRADVERGDDEQPERG